MKQFLGVLVLAILVTMSGRAESLASTMAECRAACDPTVGVVCAGLPPHRFARCGRRYLRQCKRNGVAATCPQPTTTTAPPPPPVVTTTVYIPPPPTTTLPPPPPVVNLTGSYQFYGYVTYDNCGVTGLGTYGVIPFSVTSQSGTSLIGLQGANNIPVTGTYTPSTGGWNLGAGWYDSAGCWDDTGIGVGGDSGFAAGVGGEWFADVTCAGVTCSLTADGLVY